MGIVVVRFTPSDSDQLRVQFSKMYSFFSSLACTVPHYNFMGKKEIIFQHDRFLCK